MLKVETDLLKIRNWLKPNFIRIKCPKCLNFIEYETKDKRYKKFIKEVGCAECRKTNKGWYGFQDWLENNGGENE